MLRLGCIYSREEVSEDVIEVINADVAQFG